MAPARKNKMGVLRNAPTASQPAKAPVRSQPPAQPSKKAKAKALPMAKARSSRGLKLLSYDPTHAGVPPSMLSIPRVFPITQTVRSDYDTVLGYRTAIFVSGWGGSATIAWRVSANSTASLIDSASFSVPLLTSAAAVSGPTSSKISKVGFRLTNATPMQTRGGRCYVCRLDQRVKLPAAPSSMSAIAWSQVMTSLISLPDSITRAVDVADFGSTLARGGKPIYSIVDDEVDYAAFESHYGTNATMDDWFSHVGIWTSSTELTRPMSCMVFIIEPPAVAANAQNLTFNFDGQWLTRWPIDTVPGQAAGTLSASPLEIVDAARRSSDSSFTRL